MSPLSCTDGGNLEKAALIAAVFPVWEVGFIGQEATVGWKTAMNYYATRRATVCGAATVSGR